MESYDLLVIGLGPAGMASAIMGSTMGLKVCAVEKNKVGGECMNVGCIPSKALLKMGTRQQLAYNPMTKTAEYLSLINKKETAGVAKKVEIINGEASFVGPQEIEVSGKRIKAKKIFIATGTRPAIPPIAGLSDVPYLTNENVFDLPEVPKSMAILGGGPIGSEMALAFHRLGCACTIVGRAKLLVPKGEPDGGKLLKERFEEYGIKVLTGAGTESIKQEDGMVVLETSAGEVRAEKLLVATGRQVDFKSMNLEAAGVKYGPRGIIVNKHLQTSAPNIYAVGDCNGHYLLSHAAMHQGMIAIMNLFIPWPFKRDFRKYPVPWSVFSDPEISHVGMTSKELNEKGIPFEVTESRYADYGASVAQEVPYGFVRVFASKRGKIYGVSVVGENASEIINEWALAMQKKLTLFDVMMTMHSFPSMGFLSKRVGEIWMMKLVQKPFAQKMLNFFKPK